MSKINELVKKQLQESIGESNLEGMVQDMQMMSKEEFTWWLEAVKMEASERRIRFR